MMIGGKKEKEIKEMCVIRRKRHRRGRRSRNRRKIEEDNVPSGIKNNTMILRCELILLVSESKTKVTEVEGDWFAGVQWG